MPEADPPTRADLDVPDQTRIFVGTSGFSFRDWVGPVYPHGTRSADMLPWYGARFPAVEVNATYYALPPPRAFERMASATPPGFRFVVKLPGEVTHQQAREAEPYRAFLRAVEPLEAAGKYHGALAQFPWSFRDCERSRGFIRQIRDRYPVLPLFVEFRHDSWASPTTLALLEELGAGIVVVDEPALPGLFPVWPEVTGRVAYVRLHGRNATDWYGSDGSLRYNYDYSDAELREWAERIRDLSMRARETLVFFNNCHAGHAAQNARRMAELLGLEPGAA